MRGFHAGTFITSHDDRGYGAGIQRVWVSGKHGDLSLDLGYRLGLVHGYDGEFLDIAERTPVLPAVLGLLNVGWKNLGAEFSYAGIVMMVGGVVRF